MSPTRSRTARVRRRRPTLEVAQEHEQQRQEAEPDDQGERPGVDDHQHRGDGDLAEAETISMRPPHCTNIEIVSTSLVTRETSEPRRSVFWVSIDRSWTCRNARDAQGRQTALGRPEEPHVHGYAETAVSSDGRRPPSPTSAQHDARVRPAVGEEPAVDRLLDRDGHDHAAGRRDQRPAPG